MREGKWPGRRGELLFRIKQEVTGLRWHRCLTVRWQETTVEPEKGKNGPEDGLLFSSSEPNGSSCWHLWPSDQTPRVMCSGRPPLFHTGCPATPTPAPSHNFRLWEVKMWSRMKVLFAEAPSGLKAAEKPEGLTRIHLSPPESWRTRLVPNSSACPAHPWWFLVITLPLSPSQPVANLVWILNVAFLLPCHVTFLTSSTDLTQVFKQRI